MADASRAVIPRIARWLATWLVCAAVVTVAPAARVDRTLVLTNATVIDVRTGARQRNVSVVVENDRITAVGPASRVRVPTGARTVNCEGRYVTPGLIDTHVHLFAGDWVGAPVVTPLYLQWIVAGGVTGLREMSADGYKHAALRDDIAAGRIIGPRLYLSAGPLPSVPDPWAALLEKTGRADRRAAIAKVRSLGADGVKLMHNGTRDEMLAAVSDARAARVPVYGHTISIRPDTRLSGDIDNFALELVEAGLSGVVHSSGTIRPPGRDPRPPPDASRETPEGRRAWTRHNMSAWEAVTEETTDALIRAMVSRRVWYEPTRLVTYYWGHLGDYDRQALPARHRWKGDVREGVTPAPPSSSTLAVEGAEARFIRRFHEAGGVVLAGTDEVPFAPYGVSEEVRLLTLAGLSPLAALQAATVNAARALGWTAGGVVERGRLADLLVLDADPLIDILNLRRIRAVVLNGRLIEREELDASLSRISR